MTEPVLVPGLVALVDPVTGRFSDSLAPPSVVANAATAAAAADTAAARAAIGLNYVVDLGSNGTTNVALINAAMTAMSTSGKANGTLTLRGRAAPIASTLTFDLGYTNIINTRAYSSERFTLKVDGSLTFAAGIGVGMLIKSGFGATIDVYLQGGGNSTDVGVQVEGHEGLDLSVQAAKFAGIVLKGDATGNTSKRIRMSKVSKLQTTDCGQCIQWIYMEAFGQFAHILDNNSVNGSLFDHCADTNITYFENYSPKTQAIGVDFVECGMFSVGEISLGDSAAILMRIKGNNFGRINQLRMSGWFPRNPPSLTVTGLVLEDLGSVDIDNLTTFRCDVGLEIRGGDGTPGINIKQHRSLTGDVVPLKITAGTSGQPVAVIGANYRNTNQGIVIGPGLTGGRLSLSGRVREALLDGASGRYVIEVDPTSSAFQLNVAGLHQYARGGGIAGSISHPTPANISGVTAATLEDKLTHGTAPAATGMVLGTSWQNATSRSVAVVVAVKLDPGVGTNAGITWRLGPSASSSVVADDALIADATFNIPENRVVRTFIVPPYWWLNGTASTGTGVTLATSVAYAI